MIRYDGVNLRYCHDLGPASYWLMVNSRQFGRTPETEPAIPYMQEIGDFYANAGFYTERHSLPSFLIKYTVSGGGVLTYRDESYRVGAGDLFWIDCHDYQRYCTDPEIGDWHVIWIHFSGGPCSQYYDLFLDRNNARPVVHLPHSINFPDYYSRLYNLYSQREQNQIKDIKASGILTEIMVAGITAAGRLHVAAPESIKPALFYIEEKYDKEITLDMLSRICSLNKYYFLRLFKRSIGCTPNEYLIRTRIHKAKELLRTTDLTIARIALDVGVKNTGHFINLFKRLEGVTPGEYRKHWW